MIQLCLLCGHVEKHLICPICACETKALIHSRHDTGRMIPGTRVPLISFASYQGKIKTIIQIAKGHRLERSALIDSWLFLASQRVGECLMGTSTPIVVPIPERRFGLDTRRRLARDFAYLVASQIGAPTNIHLLKHHNILHQIFGKAQKERNRWQRLTLPPEYRISTRSTPTPGKKVILVDDVCTTGGSLRAAIKPLMNAGFEVSAAVSLADTPYHH